MLRYFSCDVTDASHGQHLRFELSLIPGLSIFHKSTFLWSGFFASVEREIKDSRRSGMHQSWHFWDKIGHAKSVGFRFYSVIWRSEIRISSRCLEITSISLIYSLTYSRKKELVFWLPGVWTDSPVWPARSEETLSWGISRLRYCDPR